ncbi:MAG: hypothetical protein JSW05_03740 [Candidatus Thorarchaeota archaeon]|nr:MAG: hypothetical protein JSW05_03740 [Candidatus Thorarchaeota archaeon]
MKTVGYFEGTDPHLLTEIVAKGCGTLPLANDWDGHGKIASHLEPGEVDLIIGFLHKLVPPERLPTKGTGHALEEYRGMKPLDLLYRAKSFEIPVLVVVPSGQHKAAKKVLSEVQDFVEVVSPDDLDGRVQEILEVQ